MSALIGFGQTDIGMKRSNNQDSFWFDNKARCYVVADGMGGHKGGEVASALAVEGLKKAYQSDEKHKNVEYIYNSIKKTNEKIYIHSLEHNIEGMGTTLSVLYIDDDDYAYFGQVGDSRCYLLRNERLYQITEDHSQVYELLKAGLVEEKDLHKVQKNIITRSVGFESKVEIDVFTQQLVKDDTLLLCSDGLSGLVSDKEIFQILMNFDLKVAVDNLIKLANLNGGDDNVTVVVAQVS